MSFHQEIDPFQLKVACDEAGFIVLKVRILKLILIMILIGFRSTLEF